MEKYLRVVGTILVIIGSFVGGGLAIAGIADSLSNPSNIGIQTLTLSIATIFSCVLSGILFLGFGEVIELLRKIANNAEAVKEANE